MTMTQEEEEEGEKSIPTKNDFTRHVHRALHAQKSIHTTLHCNKCHSKSAVFVKMVFFGKAKKRAPFFST